MYQFLANGLCKGSVYAIVAVGFSLIYTTTGVFHIAHGFVYTLGAYGLFCGVVWLNLPVWAAVPVSLVICISAGIAIDILVYRPLHVKHASSSIMMISSLGVYLIGVNLLALVFGDETRIIRWGSNRTFHLGNVILSSAQILQVVVVILSIVTYGVFLSKSVIGRVCRAVADDAVLAEVLGVNVAATRTFAFALGSLFAAAGGILSAMDLGMDPYVGLPAALVAAVACIIAGINRFLAPVLGGLLLAITQSLVVWKTSAHWGDGVTFGILVVFLLFRPQGLLGQMARREETR